MKKRQKSISKTITTVLMVSMMVLTISLPTGASPSSAISDNEKVGVLVLAHGSTSESWCTSVRNAVADPNLDYPVEIGFLEMVDNETIPDAVDKLDEHGVTKIIAVPLFISSSSGHIDEIRYILGLIDEAPEEGLVQVNTDAEIVMTGAMDDHSFIAKIIADRAAELTQDAENETVVIALHGSTSDELYGWIESSASLADKAKLILRHSMGVNIEEVTYGFINVDGSSEELAGYEISKGVGSVSESSHPIVIPVFVCEGYYTNTKIPHLLEDVDYSYPEEGSRALIPHSNVGDWIEIMVAKELSYPKISIYDDGTLETISLDDLEACLCGICAYRSSLEAFSYEDVWDGIPQRSDVSIISAHPSDGHEATFLYILGDLNDDYEVDAPEGTGETYLTPENYAYRFIQKSTGDSVDVSISDDVFYDRMYDLRTKAKLGTASAEEKLAFQLLKSMMQEKMTYGPSDELFDVTLSTSDALIIASGWDFISVPYELDDASIDSVFSDVDYDVLLYYNTASGMWEQGDVDFTELEPLKAYWIKNSQGYAQLVSSEKLEPEVPAVPATITLHEGWNAIGYSDTTDLLSAEMTLQSMDDSYSLIKGPYNSTDMTYGYVGHNGETGVISGNHVGTDAFEMAPYNGYWVLVTQETTLYGF
ncbi:sirohydrochlorin chelatase [Methanolobus psychrotolerans]|uniref:sirohydrochlorin chelatase n=1 Tax=Methanolobus psychrotolerans TaxID=1874706 RepID=UPI000B917E5C|nr:CbiX/SirB N-terminal domain-containing protein [Methanolobus psychrotolerans]